MKKLILLMLTHVIAFSFISCDGDTPAPGEDAGTGGNGGPVITIPDADATLENTAPEYTKLESLFGEISKNNPTSSKSEYEYLVNGSPILKDSEEGYEVVKSYGPFIAGQTIVTENGSNDIETVNGVGPTQEQQNAFDEIMASCTEVQTYSGNGDLTESASSYTFSVKIAADLSAGAETFDVQVEALFYITIGEGVSKYVFYIDVTESMSSTAEPVVKAFVVEIDGTPYNIPSHTDLFNYLYEFIK